MEGMMDEKGLVLRCEVCGTRNRVRYADLGKAAQCGQCKAALALPDGPIAVHADSTFHAAAANSALPIVVDFWAAWCGPCKMMAPEFEKAAHILAGEALLLKVDTEELPAIAAEFRVSSI